MTCLVVVVGGTRGRRAKDMEKKKGRRKRKGKGRKEVPDAEMAGLGCA